MEKRRQRVLQIPFLYPMIQLPVLNRFHAVDTTELLLSDKKDKTRFKNEKALPIIIIKK